MDKKIEKIFCYIVSIIVLVLIIYLSIFAFQKNVPLKKYKLVELQLSWKHFEFHQ